MFKQLKSAIFWYYLIKFRKRVVFIFLLLSVAFFANSIYGDIIEYLKIKNKLEFLEIVLLSKWVIIIFNLVLSVYLILTIFKKEEKIEQTKNDLENDKFTEREKKFLYKKKLETKADFLIKK